ncbi:MAG: tRNA (guanosine(46)-N7)-methyltransferase TrmB, partial [Clostridiales Family XIII bacterium]|nr:tRNA (guanosine(46)-N7)-methyltransferase TrmB [Clostridiales Family XIII bacterium]
LEKAEAAGLRNILFSRLCLSRPGDMFAEGELDGIFLNFSDPWPKDRHAVRRLTHRGFLAQYLAILRPGACVEFRTDDTGFFRFSLLEFEASGFSLLDATEDLGGTLLPARAFASEYERRFVLLNRRICYLRAAREGGGAAAP